MKNFIEDINNKGLNHYTKTYENLSKVTGNKHINFKINTFRRAF